MEDKIRIEWLTYLIPATLLIILITDMILQATKFGFKDSPSWFSGTDFYPIDKIIATLLVHAEVPLFFIGFFLCDKIYFIKSEFAIGMRYLSSFIVLLIGLFTWCTNGDQHYVNGISKIISMVLISIYQGVLYYIQKKPRLEQGADVYLRFTLLILSTTLGACSIICWFFNNKASYIGYAVATYIFIISVCIFVVSLRKDFSGITITFVFEGDF